MIASLAANLLVLVHFTFILFVVLGGLVVLRRPKVAYWHLPCVVWGVLVEMCGWLCPLTPLEWHLLEQAGQSGYAGGFIEHYILPLVYPAELTRGMQIGFGAFVLAVNLLVYGTLVVKWKKSRRDRPRWGK